MAHGRIVLLRVYVTSHLVEHILNLVKDSGVETLTVRHALQIEPNPRFDHGSDLGPLIEIDMFVNADCMDSITERLKLLCVASDCDLSACVLEACDAETESHGFVRGSIREAAKATLPGANALP
jgi:hypothetical protein